jgi:hypothetical protein
MDPAALDALKVAKEVASEWERIVQPGMCFIIMLPEAEYV